MAAIELFLKASVLKPVVHGLILLPGLAEAVVEATIKQPGFDRYTKLLAGIYKEVARIDLDAVTRPGATTGLLLECAALQKLRNHIVHQGASATTADSGFALAVARAVFEDLVLPIVSALELRVIDRGEIVRA